MPAEHQGFKFYCDSARTGCEPYETGSLSERTAISHARAAGWFIGTIRVMSGFAKRLRRTKKVTYCPNCKWRLGVD